jgi:serine/threonine protein kinase
MTFSPTGRREAYALSKAPIGEGGYAQVFKARVKATDEFVAFKRSRSRSAEDLGRLRREIQVQETLQPNEHSMPVWDSDPEFEWYVMPLALGDAEALRSQLLDSEERIADVIRETMEGIRPAHERGLVHRDITPRNILALGDLSAPVWVIGDWGLVRRPLGETTNRWTRSGVQLGTEGFVAPEVLRDPHQKASIKSDIYSLGRVIGWAATGIWPLTGSRELPHGRFRRVVRESTQEDPVRRPTLEQFANLLDQAFDVPLDYLAQAADLVSKAQKGDSTSALALWEMCLDKHEDCNLLVDNLARLPSKDVKRLVRRSVFDAQQLLDAMTRCMNEEGDWQWGKRQWSSLDSRLSWFSDVTQAAVDIGDMGFLEDAAASQFRVEAKWQQYDPRHQTRAWLERLSGAAADAVARALREEPGAIDWYMDEGWEPSGSTAASIRGVLRTPR